MDTPRFAPTNNVPPSAGELLATLVQNHFLPPAATPRPRRADAGSVEVTLDLDGYEIPVVVEYVLERNVREDGEYAPGFHAVAQALALAGCAKTCAACKALAAKIPLDLFEITDALERVAVPD